MLRKLGFCLLFIGVLVSQIAAFSAVETISEVTEWVKTQEGELTQGLKEEIFLKANNQFDLIMIHAKTDMAGKTNLKELNALVSESVIRLDPKQAVDLMDAYSEIVLAYIKSGNVSPQDVQWATNEFMSIMGKKVKGIEGVNVSRTTFILEDIVAANAVVQGSVPVILNQIVTLDDLNQQLLNIEKAHRVTTSQLTSLSYKDLGRELPKQLVLISDGEGIQVTLTAELMKQMVADQVELLLMEKGIIYEIPVEYMSKHVGDFKVEIKVLPVSMLESYGDKVNDGRVEPVVARDIKIGYATNNEKIKIRLSDIELLETTYVKMPYSVIYNDDNQWVKVTTTKDKGMLTGNVSGTTILGLAKYYPTYTDLEGHWAEARVSTLLSMGIVDRKNTEIYDLNGVMTRGDFVEMLINIVGTEGKSVNTFTDVPASSPYADIIESAIYYGFTIGVSGDKFEPNSPLTREELVALVDKMHDVKYGYKLDSGFLRFKDMNDISPYAKDAVSALKDAGYISGYDDNTFRPKNTVTRAEAISVLYNVLKEE